MFPRRMSDLLDLGVSVRVAEPDTDPWDGVIIRFTEGSFSAPGEEEVIVMRKADYDTSGQSHAGNTARVEVQYLTPLDPGASFRTAAAAVLEWLSREYIIAEDNIVREIFPTSKTIEELATDFAETQLRTMAGEEWE